MNKERSYDHNGSHNKMSYTATERKEIENALTHILYAKDIEDRGDVKVVKESLRNSPERVNGVFTKTIRLKEILEMNLIFDERFQRPFVWSESHQSKFIKSAIEGVPCGMAVFSVSKLRNKEHSFSSLDAIVIDMCQRGNTSKDFVNGDLTLVRDTIVEIKGKKINIGGMNIEGIRQLPEGKEIIRRFNQYPITIRIGAMDYKEATKQFVATNSGVKLKPAEIRNAMAGFLRDDIAKHGTGDPRQTLFRSTFITGGCPDIDTCKDRFLLDDLVASLYGHLYGGHRGYTSSKLEQLYLKYQETVDSEYDEKMNLFDLLMIRLMDCVSYNQNEPSRKIWGKGMTMNLFYIIEIFKDYELKNPRQLNEIVNELFDYMRKDYNTIYRTGTAGKKNRTFQELTKADSGAYERQCVVAHAIADRPDIMECFTISKKEYAKISKQIKDKFKRISTHEEEFVVDAEKKEQPKAEEKSEGLKKCGVCKELKPKSEFTKDCTKKDGLRRPCKQCVKTKKGVNVDARRGDSAQDIDDMME